MAGTDEILAEIRVLKLKLYGENGFEGDVPEMKAILKEQSAHFDDHSKRLVTLETQLVERAALSRKQVGASGGIGAVIGATVAAVIDYVIRRTSG